ncbi:MAG: 8-oxo-dGTP diphosphatase [Chloroflexi bacterium]|nr:8-oxo-dGTP diphosphatase [Chloroflexota bacterium]
MQNRTLCFLTRGHPPSEVLLGLKKFGFGAGKYTGFGGGVEAGETIEAATVRELEEETGIKVSVNNLHKISHLTFLFPSKPAWSQIVHVFLAKGWEGNPVESDEMKPIWYKIEEIPFASMWADASYWLPLVLRGKKIKARFVFKDDNETVGEAMLEDWPDGEASGTTLA